MNLPNLFAAQAKPDAPDRLVCLILSDNSVQACLVKLEDESFEELSRSKQRTYTDAENCLIRTDEALQDLGPESESVDQVVFCLGYDWIDEGEVVDIKKPLIKTLIDELSLQPLGFIESSEALVEAHVSTNSLFSGLIIFLSTDHLIASAVLRGQTQAVIQVGRSQDLVADTKEALARIIDVVGQDQALPLRIILTAFEFSQGDLQQDQQTLLEHDWSTEACFPQMPTIDILNANAFVEIMIGAATKAVLAFHNQLPKASVASASATSAATSASTPSASVVQADELANEDEDQEGQKSKGDSSDSGDSGGTDDGANTSDDSDNDKSDTGDDKLDSTQASSFGVPIDSKRLDLGQSTVDSSSSPTASSQSLSQSPTSPSQAQGSVDPSTVSADALQKGGASLVSKITLGWSRLKTAWRQPYQGSRSPTFFMMSGVVLGILALILVAWISAQVKANVMISLELEATPVSTEVDLILDTQAHQADPQNRILPAEAVTVVVEGEHRLATTGTQVVGEPARGKVRLINKTEAPHTFEAETPLRLGDLEFFLDERTTVASSSVEPRDDGTGEDREYGQAEASVTAAFIGDEGNLSEGDELQIGSFAMSTYQALVMEDFEGGESEEVAVVTAEDQTQLASQLRLDLVEEAVSQLRAKSGNGRHVLPTNMIVSEDITYSAEVNEEASTLTAQLKLEVQGFAYLADDLRPLASSLLEAELEEGFELLDGEPQIMSSLNADDDPIALADTDEPVTISVNVVAWASPAFDQDVLVSELVGLPFEDAKRRLDQHPEVKSAQLRVSPRMLGIFINSIPTNLDRIYIQSSVQQEL